MSKDPKEVSEQAGGFGVAFQAEGTACAQALRQGCVCGLGHPKETCGAA